MYDTRLQNRQYVCINNIPERSNLIILIRGEIFRKNTREQDFVNCMESIREHILCNVDDFTLVYDVVSPFVDRVLRFLDRYRDIIHVTRVKHVASKNQVRTVIDSIEFTKRVVEFDCPMLVIRCDLFFKSPFTMKPSIADLIVPWKEKNSIGGTSDMFFVIMNLRVISILYDNIDRATLHFLGRSQLHVDTFFNEKYCSDTSKEPNPVYDIVDRNTATRSYRYHTEEAFGTEVCKKKI